MVSLHMTDEVGSAKQPPIWLAPSLFNSELGWVETRSSLNRNPASLLIARSPNAPQCPSWREKICFRALLTDTPPRSGLLMALHGLGIPGTEFCREPIPIRRAPDFLLQGFQAGTAGYWVNLKPWIPRSLRQRPRWLLWD